MTAAVRWGFLGAGYAARVALGPAVHAAANATLYAVAARDPRRAVGLGPAGPAYAAYDDLLADPAVDAVYVALPNDDHLPWTLRAVAAGKPVLCEKPLGRCAAEVDRMAEAVGTAGGTVVEACWYLWHPRIRLARELIASGRIGPVRRVTAGFTFTARDATTYRLDPAKGGGALLDLGPYVVSAARWACGPAGGWAQPVRVRCRARRGPTGVDLTAAAELQFADGALAELRVSLQEPERQWLVVTGANGSIELVGARAFSAWRDDDTALVVSDGQGSQQIPVGAVDAYRVMVEEFSAVVRGGPGWLLPLAESRAAAAVLDGCFASARADGATIRLT